MESPRAKRSRELHVAAGWLLVLAAFASSIRGILLSLALLWLAPTAPQGLPLLMVFGVAAVLTLTGRGGGPRDR